MRVSVLDKLLTHDSPEAVPETPWLADLRAETRQALIRRMALERIENGGLEESTVEVSRFSRILESVGIGIVVVIAANWAIHKLGIGGRR